MKRNDIHDVDAESSPQYWQLKHTTDILWHDDLALEFVYPWISKDESWKLSRCLFSFLLNLTKPRRSGNIEALLSLTTRRTSGVVSVYSQSPTYYRSCFCNVGLLWEWLGIYYLGSGKYAIFKWLFYRNNNDERGRAKHLNLGIRRQFHFSRFFIGDLYDTLHFPAFSPVFQGPPGIKLYNHNVSDLAITYLCRYLKTPVTIFAKSIDFLHRNLAREIYILSVEDISPPSYTIIAREDF